MIVYAKDYAGLKHLIVQSPIYLEGFYRLWIFDYFESSHRLKKTNIFSFLKSKQEHPMFHLMRLNLETFERAAKKESPELLEMVEQAKHEPAFAERFGHSYFPDKDTLQRYFKTAELPSFS